MEPIKKDYTRVTQILSKWKDFSHIPQKVFENKSNIGTKVHQAIHADHQGIYMPLSDSEKGYFESYLMWKEAMKPSYVEMEQRIYDDRLMITGQVDAVLNQHDKNMIIDFKTSAQVDRKFWILQGAFYHLLYRDNRKDISISDEVLFIHLDKEGKMPTVHSYPITPEEYIVCMSCINVYRHFYS